MLFIFFFFLCLPLLLSKDGGQLLQDQDSLLKNMPLEQYLSGVRQSIIHLFCPFNPILKLIFEMLASHPILKRFWNHLLINILLLSQIDSKNKTPYLRNSLSLGML